MPEQVRFDQVSPGKNDNVTKEEKRLTEAYEKAVKQITDVAEDAIGLSAQDKAIIDVQLMLLRDPSLRKNIADLIRKGDSAEFALKKAVTADISPVKLLSMRQPNLKGIILAKGGRTSHTVILALSLEIPIVISVDNLFDNTRHGDYVILDGASGLVYPNPSQQIIEEYTRRKGESQKAQQKLLALKDQPAVTLDGYHMRLGANIGLLLDVAMAKKVGADHIGLYRTEFPYLLRKTFPTEEEQTEL